MNIEDTQAPDSAPDSAPDNDDAPNPVADWTPDCDGRPPNQRLIRLGKAFVDFCEGDLSEGQIVQMTGLDRLKVREIDALFNQAVGLLGEALAEAAAAPVAPAEPITGGGARLVYVALDGRDVEAIGNTKEEARAGAIERRSYYRDQARGTGLGFPPEERDEDWSAGLTFITLSGTVENLRLLIAGNQDLNSTPPWCPPDLWDNPEPTQESPCFEMT